MTPTASPLAFPEQQGANTLTPDESARIDAIFAAWDRVDSPGVALGIYRDGELAYTRGYGMSNLEHGIPIVPSSIFHIASISKQFAGMAIALLADEGKLDVDADIRTWLPEVPDFGATITLRHLMLHTSGLRDQWVLLALAGWREEDLVTDADVLDLVSRQESLNFPPGERYMYCNTGYTLMSLVVKRITGQSLRQFTQERIFGPLSMTRTHFHDDHSEIVPGRTQAYLPRDGGGYRISIPEFDVAGATSLFSTVEDFFHWNEQFTTERIAPASVLAEFQQPGTTNDGKEIGYGWGIATESWRGVTLIGHSGGDHGYRSHYLRAPEHGIGVTAFSNISNSNPGQLVHQVFEVLLGDVLEPVSLDQSAVPDSTGDAPADLERLAGVYRNPDEALTISVTAQHGQLFTGFDDPKPLTSTGGLTFQPDDMPGLIHRFEPEASTLHLDAFGVMQVALPRVDLAPLDKDDLDAIPGEFASDELGVTWRIVAGDGGLIFKRRKADDTRLHPAGTDVMVFGNGFGAMEVSLERDPGGTVSGFTVANTRVRNLRFRRQ